MHSLFETHEKQGRAMKYSQNLCDSVVFTVQMYLNDLHCQNLFHLWLLFMHTFYQILVSNVFGLVEVLFPYHFETVAMIVTLIPCFSFL